MTQINGTSEKRGTPSESRASIIGQYSDECPKALSDGSSSPEQHVAAQSALPNQPRPVTMSMISVGSSNSTLNQELQSSDGELWEACRIGDLERVKDLLSGRGSSINARDISGRRNQGLKN